MSKRLFSYPQDAEKEAQGVKKLLEQHRIDYYESPGSRWGFSNPAIWIKNDDDIDEAKRIFDQFQQEYAQQARESYRRETGYDPNAPFLQRFTFAFTRLLSNFKLMLLLIIAIALLYIYLNAFFSIFSATGE